MADKDNNIFDLEGDALDEALMAAIEQTDEEERLAREQKAKENQKIAEQARVSAIEQQNQKAKIDELRATLPNEGRRYFLMAEQVECDAAKKEAVIEGIVFGTCKKDDSVYIYRNDGRAISTKVLDIEVQNGQIFEPQDSVSSKMARVKVVLDYEKTGFSVDEAVPKFSVLTSVRPPVKDEKGKVTVENPSMSGLMFRYPEFNKDKEYLDHLMNNIANGHFLVPAMKTEENPDPSGKKKLKIVMVTKKEDPNVRMLPLFTDIQALLMWKKLFEGEQKPSVITMSFLDASKFADKDGFDLVFNPSGPVSVGLPSKAVKAMTAAIQKQQGNTSVKKEVINDGSKVMVGQPRPGKETGEVREALIAYCQTNRDIDKAGLLYIMRNGKVGYLVILDAPKDKQQEVFKGVKDAVAPYLKTIKTVDFSLLSEAPFAKDYFKKIPYDYLG